MATASAGLEERRPLLLPSRAGAPSPRDAARLQPLLLRRPHSLGLLTLFLTLLFVLPARYVVGGLGAAGRPAVFVGAGLFVLYLAAGLHLRSSKPHRGRGLQPVRWIVGFFVLVQMATYTAGHHRGLPLVEASGADRWLIVTFAMAGVALAAADGLASRRQVDTLLKRLVLLAGFMSAVGALQVFLRFDLTRHLDLPGLELNAGLISIAARGDQGGFARVAGTAGHYIEFGVVAAMVLPLAVHFALVSPTARQRFWWWALVGLVAAAIPFSISRAAVVGAVVALVTLAVVWTWRLRVNALVWGVLLTVAFAAARPGLLGTIRSLFENVGRDDSISGRTDDYAVVFPLIAERPWLGRGAGTFLPEEYLLLDNQYLYVLAESGLAGLLAFVAVLGGGYALARSVRLRGVDEPTRHLGQALAASFLVGLVTSATFDSFSFAVFTGLTFVLLGVAGALWRLGDGGRGRRPIQRSPEAAQLVLSPLMAPPGPAPGDR